MLAASLPTDVWLGVGFVAAITVLACLGVMANILRYELEVIYVVASVKKLRDKLASQIDVAEMENVEEPTPAARRPEMIDSPSPMPDSGEAAETDAISGSPPEPDAEPNADAEPVATDAAQAA